MIVQFAIVVLVMAATVVLGIYLQRTSYHDGYESGYLDAQDQVDEWNKPTR